MFKLISALAGSALIAGLIVLPMSVDVSASTPTAAVKGDRLDLRSFGGQCSTRGWPHYEAKCLRDVVSPTREARAVRVVAMSRD